MADTCIISQIGKGIARIDTFDAVVKIKKVKKELKALKIGLQEKSAQERAEKLDAKIKEFERKNDIEEY